MNIYWQAHRGGGAYERPDNTMSANRYAWELGGIPEADIRTTNDGVIVCLHDETPARTTTAPDEVKNQLISEFTFAETRLWDAGIKFNEAFQGECIPSLEEVFQEMKGRPERMMYLDLKEVNLSDLGRLIDQYEVNRQVIFTHYIQDNCRQMKEIAREVRSMLWIGGNAEQRMEKFRLAASTGFEGLDQVQFHLKIAEGNEDWSFDLEPAFLTEALALTERSGIDLELFPFSFDASSLHQLLDLGIRWYATDEPALFLEGLNSWNHSK
ncbi:glycerophosphodiester phosphodiesterase family protein [Paenibacillus sp. KQZ6P-2]|uniref:Glycerophosphodiester phosphodiesterase family protein n=1 Tax=Paenibacillus mangrovi TaxID=2931978 RepID=A0A9X1WNY9_9BACL|nr:glycerophosphodiester phosphodiesterase family protein [Paenibacillus mangrovi]MCJ8011996.1 glycerophosphodiester phosphodiesterase family protein [Paenibacillus mangrovi]